MARLYAFRRKRETPRDKEVLMGEEQAKGERALELDDAGNPLPSAEDEARELDADELDGVSGGWKKLLRKMLPVMRDVN